MTARHLTAFVDSGTAQIFTSGTTWDTTGNGTKAWTTTAGIASQKVTYAVGDCTPGRTYNVFKNGVLLYSLQADTLGNLSFSDVPGTLNPVSFTVSPT